MCYRYFIVVFLSFILMAGKARSQESINAEVFAEVIEALAANENQSLNFGRFTTGTDGGSILISPDGIRSSQGSVVAAGGGYSPGKFFVKGDPDATFSIQLPETATLLVHSESGKTMDVGGWVSDPPSGDAATLLDGTRMVSIGATLNVGSVEENPVGLYSGAFVVTFAYN